MTQRIRRRPDGDTLFPRQHRIARHQPAYPELPTIAEAGVPGFQAVAWNGLVAPAGVSPDIVKRLDAVFVETMATPTVRARLIEGGLDPVGDPPESFARFIPAEISKWSKIAKDVGARADQGNLHVVVTPES